MHVDNDNAGNLSGLVCQYASRRYFWLGHFAVLRDRTGHRGAPRDLYTHNKKRAVDSCTCTALHTCSQVLLSGTASPQR